MHDDALMSPEDHAHRTAVKRTLGGVIIVVLLLVTLAIQPAIGAPAATVIFWVGTVAIIIATRLR